MTTGIPQPITPQVLSRCAWITVAVLTGCYLVSSLDRFAIGLLIQPIAHSLGLSDIKISLLIGIAFTLFYGTAGIALGGIVDRNNRCHVIIAGILIWTLATAATAFAQNYTSLLLARLIVGIGEATLAPSAYSLIAEAFPRDRLTRPTTIYFLGGAIGPGFSLVMGGVALHFAEKLAQVHQLGWLGNEPWRFVMLMAAAPGLVSAALVSWLVRDPRPRRRKSTKLRSTGSLCTELRSKPFLYLGLIGGTTGVSVYINGLATWWATYALRHFGWPLKTSGIYFGFALAVGALSGILASGSVGTVLSKRFGDAGNGVALTSLAIVGSPLFVGVPLVTAPAAQLILVTFALAFAFAINALAPVGCQLAANPQVRGRVLALYVAITTVIGAGFGPPAVAWLEAVRLRDQPVGLGGALSLVGLVCSIVMIITFNIYRKAQGKEIPVARFGDVT